MKVKNLTPVARKLRNNLTEAEKRLWNYLRYKQLDGLRFRRQQPLGPYIVDFVNFEKRIIIEIDGGQHNENPQNDVIRDNWFKEQNFKVLRFWNNEVIENIEGVLEIIKRKCFSLPNNTPHLTSPARGEEVNCTKKSYS